MIISRPLDGARVDTLVNGKFSIMSDQPAPFGEDSAATPFDIFLAGIASCTAFYAQRYCRKWNLPHQGISVELEPIFDEKHRLADVKMKLKVPADFPADHLPGLLKNAGNCLVKKTMEAPPAMSLELAIE